MGMPTQAVEMVHTKYGWMMCPPGDIYVTGSLKQWGVYSETEALILSEVCSHRNVLMAGGHIGGLVLPIGQTAGIVVAYEPQPMLYKLLEANVAINDLDHKVWVNNRAIGAKDGIIQVPMISLDCKYNMGRFGREDWEKPYDADVCAKVRMDDINRLFQYQNFDFMLLDVEGMELDILQAAAPSIKNKPGMILWVECDRPDNGDQLIQFIYDLGYTPYWMITPLTPDDVRPDSGPWPMQCSFNLLCLRKGEEWPLGDVPQFVAKPGDPIGTCGADKIIFNVREAIDGLYNQ